MGDNEVGDEKMIGMKFKGSVGFSNILSHSILAFPVGGKDTLGLSYKESLSCGYF